MTSTGALEEDLRHAETYEDYLDSFLTETDRLHLPDEKLARQLVEIGCLKGTVLSREEFYSKAEALDEQQRSEKRGPGPRVVLPAFVACPATSSVLLRQVAAREELIRCGSLSTIIFIRHMNAKGLEISAYIDLADRLKAPDFPDILAGKKKLLPRASDLSYYNWATKVLLSRDSADFLVVAGEGSGMLFRHRRDRKLINPNPGGPPGDNTKRTEVETEELLHLVFYDHTCRKKS
ncbi:uncharacterized protein C4orf22 homolog [Cyclospora cayetanensis]|uniref:Cilia- and flagella-associated protein 299 n=1 Tax=Cyclospora cayetanensis TaxID=88456 RepID=A0A6P6RSV2_9EIME|nr:uncharacterized protein C4orf22 homolog [Cyclospora cayetanensis]